MIRHVLCPIDFSDFSRHALDHAVAIAHLYEARVTVLHVASPAHEGMTVPRLAPDVVPAGPVLYKRILCGVDFSDASMAALSYALSLAQQADAWLGVVHVVELLPDVYDTPFRGR